MKYFVGAYRHMKKIHKLQYTFKSDVLFKMLFIKNTNLLKRLLSTLLEIPYENIDNFIIRNTEIPPEEIGKKFCRLDINMTVNDVLVSIEIQVANEGNYKDRSLYNWSKIFVSSLGTGENYKDTPKVITINILDFILFDDNKEVHSEYKLLEVTRYTQLTDKMSIHFFELPKLNEIESLNFKDKKQLWLALFNAETKEELDILQQIGGDVMAQAIEAYESITADKDFIELERLRAKTRFNESHALYHAEQRGARKRDEFWQTEVDKQKSEIEKLQQKIKELETPQRT